MTPLPEPVQTCRVPALFSPSHLASGEQCALRVVLAAGRAGPALTAHPAAALGRVFHSALEMAVRGEIPRQGTPREDAERALEHLLDDEDQRIADEWTGPSPKLRELYAPLTWRRKRRNLLDLVERYLSGDLPGTGTRHGGTGRRAIDLPRTGRWSEVDLEVPSLRLRGRADLLVRIGGDVCVRDLKTGRASTRDGDVLPHIQRQMRLYGLLARALWPSARVSLFVDDGTEREVAFGEEDEANTLNWLKGLLSLLPADEMVQAEALARPGEACETCPHRHRCTAYMRIAPKVWREHSSVRMPLDTWGDVVDITTRGSGLVDLSLVDAARRTVKLFGLMESRTAGCERGDEIWLFGLRTRDRRGGPSVWRHPQNFFELSDDDLYARAWSLESFLHLRGRRGDEPQEVASS